MMIDELGIETRNRRKQPASITKVRTVPTAHRRITIPHVVKVLGVYAVAT